MENSSQNPVYYVQYAHARICSIVANLKSEGFEISDVTREQLNLMTTPQETELIRFLAGFPNEVDLSAKDYDPAKITKYVVDLATHFHKFYDACSVKNAESEDLKKARLLLCDAVRQTIKNILGMLKITCPEKM